MAESTENLSPTTIKEHIYLLNQSLEAKGEVIDYNIIPSGSYQPDRPVFTIRLSEGETIDSLLEELRKEGWYIDTLQVREVKENDVVLHIETRREYKNRIEWDGCPQCGKNNLLFNKLPDGGRNVYCPNCGSQWELLFKSVEEKQFITVKRIHDKDSNSEAKN